MKKIMTMAAVAAGVACCAGWRAGAADYPERWNYGGGSVMTEESAKELTDLLRMSKAAGCTHLLWVGSRAHRIPELTAEQRGRAARFHAEAEKLGVKVVPSVISIGYSGKYFNVDPNLAAGVPVKNMPYLVRGGRAEPDPALALDAAGMTPSGTVVRGTFRVPPFMYYRVTFRDQGQPKDIESYVSVTSSGGRRRNCRTNPTLRAEGDRNFVETVFNTLEGEEIAVTIRGVTKVEDLKIEPAGMLLILRRPLIPLTVTDESGKVTYEEGRDFRPVADPVIAQRPFPGDFHIDHAAPAIELTEGSRIPDGGKLLVSFWHHVRIYGDQDLISMQDPAAWDIFETEVRETVKLHPAGGYSLNYDEIRVAGWEPWPDGKAMAMGQLLAAHFRRAYDLVRKYAPKATIYTWSDMFTPHHNAYPFEPKGYYYLANGNWDGSWEGLPKDVAILNWYSPDDRTTRFFADRGHAQVLCGFYDATKTEQMKANISRWLRVSKGIPNVRGFMYTTWHRNYAQLDEYFKLLETSGDWGREIQAPPPAAP